MSARSAARRFFIGLKRFMLIGVLVISLLLAAMWTEHRMPLELPQPTGPFQVGRANMHWVFADPVDEFAPTPGSPRELMAWIWYPSTPGTGAPADYLPGPWRDAVAQRGGILMTDFLTRDLSKVHDHSWQDADISPVRAKYPVVILRGGLAAQVTGYAALAEDLASHGYIVVGTDAPYRTSVVVLPEDRTVLLPAEYNLELMPASRRVSFAMRLMAMWSEDIGLTIDRLTALDATPSSPFAGRIDLGHIGILGHSLGGATAANFCHEDPRCKAGVDLDGRLFGPVIKDGLRQPFMFVLEDHESYNDPDNVLRDIQATYSKSQADSRLKISIAGSNHFSFSDQIVLKSHLLLAAMRGMHAIGPLEGARGLAVTADCARSFFDVYLKGEARSALDTLPNRNPEIILE